MHCSVVLQTANFITRRVPVTWLAKLRSGEVMAGDVIISVVVGVRCAGCRRDACADVLYAMTLRWGVGELKPYLDVYCS